MKTSSETTNQQNVINFELLITVITTFGDKYNPPIDALKVPTLNDLLQKGKLSLEAVTSAKLVYKGAIAAQNSGFEGFDSLITRIINSLRIIGVPKQTLEQAESIVRELRGKRASDLLSEEELAAEKEKGNEIKQVAVHNASIARKLENFNKFILFLEQIKEYSPNEQDLTTAALRIKQADMQQKSTDLSKSDVALEAARINRDEILYADTTGIVDTALSAKQYVKSLYGASDPRFKQVNSIPFTNK